MVLNKKGFTLVEVIVTSAIVLLLLTAVYSFFSLSQRIYRTGSEKVDLHHSVRLASERVIREIRFANELVLLDEWEIESANTERYKYIYFDSDNKAIVLLDEEGSHSLSDSLVSNFTFSSQGNTLLFTVTGEHNTTNFSLDSSVTLLNFSGLLPNPENPVAIRFAVPDIGSGTGPSPDPEPDPDPPADPDPSEPDVQVDFRVLHHHALPIADKSNPSFTATLEWEEAFPGNITDISLSFSRTIEGHRQNSSSSFTGEWRLSIFYNGADHPIASESIVQPRNTQTYNHTISEYIPENQPVKVILYITYWYGGHNKNWIKPVFSDIQLEVTYFK